MHLSIQACCYTRLFNGFLADLLTYIITTLVSFSGMVGRHKVAGKHMLTSYTSVMELDPLVFELSQTVIKLIDILFTNIQITRI